MRLGMSFVCLFVLASFLASFSAQAQTADADFQQAVAEYQKMDSDHWQAATAEKVIKLAAAMEKLPPIPEEARKHFVMGQTIFKDAKSRSDFSMACQEFYQALHLAPWWPDAWYNIGLVHEALGNYTWSMVSLQLYMLFKLPDAEARAVQDKIYALQAKQAMAANDKALADQKAAEDKAAAEKAAQEAAAKARESSPEAVAARKQNEYDAWLRSLDGARFISSPWASGSMDHNGELEYGLYYIVGKEVFYGMIDSWNSNGGNFRTAPIFRQNHWTRATIQGKQFLSSTGSVGTISDDGQTITDRASGQQLGQVYTRIR